MVQYQSFPDAAGGSRTLDKLKALRLPDLRHRSFLDVGCNEGFFCGFAKFQGADVSVGIDNTRTFIERARRRFPDCEFLEQGWEKLPKGPFDVILLASALHYADDQPQLVHRLAKRLSPDGVLVLEVGIVSSKKSEWIKVQRGPDERFFPSMPKMREVLKRYAWKWMGPSVSQDGDPVGRHVFHISRRRPLAYLLLQPPGYGKTSIAASLFAPGHVKVVSGDLQPHLVSKGSVKASKALREALLADFSPFRIDQTIQRIFDQGLGPDLVKLWLSQAGEGDFALEGYVPAEYQATVDQQLIQAGYLPVTLRWEPAGPRALPAETIDSQTEAFYLSMIGDKQGKKTPTASQAKQKPVGFVDELGFENGVLTMRGWAIDAGGALPPRLAVDIGGQTIFVEQIEKQMRLDVQRHLHLPHALVGYRARVAVPGVEQIDELKGRLQVFAADSQNQIGHAFQFAAPIAGIFGSPAGGRLFKSARKAK